VELEYWDSKQSTNYSDCFIIIFAEQSSDDELDICEDKRSNKISGMYQQIQNDFTSY